MHTICIFPVVELLYTGMYQLLVTLASSSFLKLDHRLYGLTIQLHPPRVMYW